MSTPLIIGNRHIQVGIDPARTGRDITVVAIVCTLCGESKELSRVTTAFASLHWDCRYSKRPVYGADAGDDRELPTSTKPVRKAHVPHRTDRALYTESGDPEA